MKRVIVKLVLKISGDEDVTAGKIIEEFGESLNGVHINHQTIPEDEVENYVLKDGDQLAYSTEW